MKFETKNDASFYHETKFKCLFEDLCSKNINMGKPDLLLISEDCLIMIKLKYNSTCEHGLIIKFKYCDIFEKHVNSPSNCKYL